MKRERGLVFLVPEGRFSGGQEGDSWWDENKYVNPYKACIYGLCRDFLDSVGYDLGTNCGYYFFISLFERALLGASPVYSPISSTVGCITIPFSSNSFTESPINKFWFL